MTWGQPSDGGAGKGDGGKGNSAGGGRSSSDGWYWDYKKNGWKWKQPGRSADNRLARSASRGRSALRRLIEVPEVSDDIRTQCSDLAERLEQQHRKGTGF